MGVEMIDVAAMVHQLMETPPSYLMNDKGAPRAVSIDGRHLHHWAPPPPQKVPPRRGRVRGRTPLLRRRTCPRASRGDHQRHPHGPCRPCELRSTSPSSTCTSTCWRAPWRAPRPPRRGNPHLGTAGSGRPRSSSRNSGCTHRCRPRQGSRGWTPQSCSRATSVPPEAATVRAVRARDTSRESLYLRSDSHGKGLFASWWFGENGQRW